MEITRTDIKRIVDLIRNIKQIKINLEQTSDDLKKEILEFKLFYFESELLKYHTDLTSCLEDELNRGLTLEEILRLYDTERNREKRKRKFQINEAFNFYKTEKIKKENLKGGIF